VVTFTEEWPRTAHGSDVRRHSWRFVVMPTGDVRFAGESGYPPAQRIA
jgi:hypothetical protein